MVAGGEPQSDGMEQRLRRALFGGGATGGPRGPTEPPGPPELIAGRYELVHVIGKGSMGEVWKARDITTGTVVALKLLRRGCGKVSATAAERFRREAELICRLDHAHIVKVSEYGELVDGRKYIVMTYIEGVSLRAHLAKDPEVSLRCACSFVRQVTAAVGTAHSIGVVHRDLSPGNILLSQRESEVHSTVIDFGLASCDDLEKLTDTGDRLGTPHYMSPEQTRGEPADRRSDIYSLGCIAYQMLTGVTPFAGPTIADLFEQHQKAPPPPFAEVAPDRAVPAGVEAVVMRALAKAPEKRWPDMASFGEAFVRACTAPPETAVPPSRRRVVALTMALCVAAALAAVVQWI